MTWIKTVPASEDERVKKAAEAQRQLYPIEYASRSTQRSMGRLRESLIHIV